jgi:hypothetical protein
MRKKKEEMQNGKVERYTMIIDSEQHPMGMRNIWARTLKLLSFPSF